MSGGGYVPGMLLSYPMDYSSVTFRRMYESHKRGVGQADLISWQTLIFSYSDSFPAKRACFANVVFSNGSLPAGFLERS